MSAVALLGGVSAVAAQSLHSEPDGRGRLKITNVQEPAPAAGQQNLAVAFYQQIDAAGRLSISDGTDGARGDQGGNSPPPAAAVSPAREVTSALARNAAMSSRRIAQIDAGEAMRRLEQARQARAGGAARQPGEHTRVGQSGALINPYQSRQDLLEGRVQSAQMRVSATRR